LFNPHAEPVEACGTRLIALDQIRRESGIFSDGIGLTLRQAQGEVICSTLMLSLAAYAEASAGQQRVFVRRSPGEGGSKHAEKG
jgi:hypothetical protein